MSTVTGILILLAVIAALALFAGALCIVVPVALTIGEAISDWAEDKFYDWRHRK